MLRRAGHTDLLGTHHPAKGMSRAGMRLPRQRWAHRHLGVAGDGHSQQESDPRLPEPNVHQERTGKGEMLDRI